MTEPEPAEGWQLDPVSASLLPGIGGALYAQHLADSDAEQEEEPRFASANPDQEIAVLNALLEDYVTLVYQPELEVSHRNARSALRDREQILFPFDPPESLESIDLTVIRQEFEKKWLNDTLIGGMRVLFKSASLTWDADVEQQHGRLEAFRKGISQWSEEWHDHELVRPSLINWNLDPKILDVLHDGRAVIGRQSDFNAMNKSVHFAKTRQLLEEIASWTPGDLPNRAQRGRRRTRLGTGNKRRVSPINSGSSRGLVNRGTGSRGLGNKGLGSKSLGRKDASQQKAKRTLKSKAASTATTAAPSTSASSTVGAKGKSRPASPAPVASAQATEGRFITKKVKATLKSQKVDVDDPYTIESLEWIYAANRNPNFPLDTARANSGEMRTLMRTAQDPSTKSVRFLEPGQKDGDRTPDIEVTKKDGSKSFVEVRTFTGASKYTLDAGVWRPTIVADAARTHAPLSLWSVEDVDRKLRHGQISTNHPGKIVFHAVHEHITEVSLLGWRGLLAKSIRDNGPLPAGLQRIEVTGAPHFDPATNKRSTRMLIFQPPNWKGVIVP